MTALHRALAVAVVPLWLSCGCASQYLRRAPPSPHLPWPLLAEATPSVRRPTGAPAIRADHVYTLPELIDVARSMNPDTRIGWERARQAALAVGIARAQYFPLISAWTLIGYQHTFFPLPNLSQSTLGINPFQILPSISFPVPRLPQQTGHVGVDTFQVLPFLGVRWQIFDLGRGAEVRAAENLSTAANALFTAEHQKVVFDVARAYFRLNAARAQVEVSRDALARTRAIAEAAEARYAQGIATVVELSEARREVAQAEYNVAQAQAGEITVYAALVSALGIDPAVHIDVAPNPSRPLANRIDQKVGSYVEAAQSGRADLRAARARLPAADARVAKSRSAYAPRVSVFGTGGAAVLGARVDGIDLPTLTLPNLTVGLTFDWLLFDGGLREVQAELARSQHDEAAQELVKLENQAVQEVITGYAEVNASLSRYQAATVLLETAAVAEDAVTKSYLNGLATFTDAMNAQKARSLAAAAREQAFADALIATTTLAFASGELVSAQAVPHPE
jgi:outer membrane protein